jgi:5-methylcytosine-specific restriction endonuclease McrA
MNIGDRFHRLVVVGLVSDSKNPKAICICDCGNTVTPQRGALRNGRAKSCGCLRSELLSAHAERVKGTGMPPEEYARRQAEAVLRWRARNPDRVKAIAKRFYARHEVRLALLRKACAVKKRIYDIQYRQANKQRIAVRRRLNDHKRRIREIENRGVVSKDIGVRLLKAQRGKCAICLKAIKRKYELDHIVPISRGGRHDDLNLQLLCPFCNRSKGAKDPIAYMQSKGFLL